LTPVHVRLVPSAVTGTPTLLLNDAGTALYQSGSGSTTLVFTYTVAAGQNTSALAITGVNLPSGASVTDAGGHSADFSAALVTFTGLQIDGMAPIITSVTGSQGTFQAGSLITIVLTLSEAVTVSGGTPTLTLNDGGTATYDAAHSTATGLVFDYMVAKTDKAASPLTILSVNQNGAMVLDADGSGNLANLSGAVTALTGTDINIAANGSTTLVTGANSTVTLGNGNDTVTAGANSTVTLGNGGDTVTAGANSTVTWNNSTVTAGNGNDTVYAGENDTIKVGNGSDFIFAGASDTINLGTGIDTVEFGVSPKTTLIGNETVNNFAPSQDIIVFNAALFVNFAAAFGAATQVGPDTVIVHDPTDTVMLHNVALASLSAKNFQFT
jgi:Ca2+-binding RTX toxin-like protein